MNKSTVVSLSVFLTFAAACDSPTGLADNDCAHQYPIAQIEQWYGRTLNVLSIEGVVFRDLDEAKGCIAVGIADVNVKEKVGQFLDSVSIPRNAAYVRITGFPIDD